MAEDIEIIAKKLSHDSLPLQLSSIFPQSISKSSRFSANLDTAGISHQLERY